MKKNIRVALESVCLIAAVSAVAVVVGNHEKVIPAMTQVGSKLSAAIFSDKNEAKEKISEMIENFPDTAEIDVTDESAAEALYNQIVEIYGLSEEFRITLTAEQETKIKNLIAFYDPADEENTQQIPETGGVLSAGTYVLQSDLSLKEQDLCIPADAEVVIDLNGHRLTGTGEGSVITVENGGTLTLKDSTFYPVFRGGSVDGGTGTLIDQDGMQFSAGGGILVNGTLHLRGGSIKNCTANSGGGVYIGDGGVFLMSGGKIDSCTVSGDQNVYGGGVQVSGSGSFQMDGGYIVGCSVKRDTNAAEESFGGGGVSVYNGDFTMNGGLISECSSEYHGGGIYISEYGAAAVLAGGSVKNCTAAVHGGGLYILNNENVSMTGGAIADCSAAGGGAVCIQGTNGRFDFQNGELIGLEDTESTEEFINAEYGGGIYVLGGSLNISGGKIRDFMASDSGGGIYSGIGGRITVQDGTLTGCKAGNNGGGIYFNGAEAVMTGGSISGCEADTNGGGIYILSGQFTIEGSAVIEGCAAGGDMILSEETDEMVIWDGGGGIFAAPEAVVYLEGGKITECSSSAFGGGIFSYGTVSYADGEIRMCSALGGGGIMIAGDSSLSISGGTVQKCHAVSGNGGGISFSDGTLTIQGNPVISENTNGKDGTIVNDNLYLPEEKQIALDGTMTEGAYIGISISPEAFIVREIPFTTKGYRMEPDIVKYFAADQENMVIELDASNQCLNIVLKQEQAYDAEETPEQ